MAKDLTRRLSVSFQDANHQSVPGIAATEVVVPSTGDHSQDLQKDLKVATNEVGLHLARLIEMGKIRPEQTRQIDTVLLTSLDQPQARPWRLKGDKWRLAVLNNTPMTDDSTLRLAAHHITKSIGAEVDRKALLQSAGLGLSTDPV